MGEREHEPTAESATSDAAPKTDDSGDPAGSVEPGADRSAESFLDLEAALSADLDGGPEGQYGLVVDAGRVDAEAVPYDYPRPVTTEEALALEIEPEPDGRSMTAFFEWGAGEDDRLDRLLEVAGVTYDTFADLNGTRLLLAPEGEYLVPVVPPREPGGSDDGYYGIVGGLAFNLLTVLALFVSPGTLATLWFILLFLVVNLLVVPGSTYVDARALETRTDWDHAPSFWAFFSAVPLVNVPVSLAYLYTRRAARSLTKS